MAALRKSPKIVARLSASQVPAPPGAMGRESFLCICIELSGGRIVCDGFIELLCVKRLEPCTKARQLPRVQLFDGLFDVFGGCHLSHITPAWRSEKMRVAVARSSNPPAHREQRAGDGAGGVAC